MSWGLVAVGAGTAVGGIAGAFGGGKSKGTVEQSKYNPNLESYTQAYRRQSPWLFASLDPGAYLASLSDPGASELGAGFVKNLQNMSAAEKQEAKDTKDALTRIRERQESGQFLTTQETEFINTSLDQAFAYAHKTGYEDWTKATQMMAGSRGMRMSDTPVAEPAMRELRNFELGLGSKRAEMGLDTTLNLSANKQAFDQSFAQFNQSLAAQRTMNRQSLMFGGGMSGAAGINQQFVGSSTETPSFMSQAGGAFDLMSKVGSAFMAAKPSAVPTPAPAAGGGGWGGTMGLNFNPFG